jgi:hypothetical protein
MTCVYDFPIIERHFSNIRARRNSLLPTDSQKMVVDSAPFFRANYCPAIGHCERVSDKTLAVSTRPDLIAHNQDSCSAARTFPGQGNTANIFA